MGFIRAKTIKGKEYAYLVSNTWTNQGSRQNVKCYLGRIIKLQKKQETTPDITNSEYTEAITSLITQELINHGFNEKLSHNNTKVDLKNRKIINNNKNTVIEINEGYMCTYTLNKLMTLKLTGYEEQAGTQLATALLEAGLKINKEIFVQLFEKIYKGNKKTKDKDE
ncbi:hypothetical protein KY314_04570 [Candidatus Woesearchaeota archaeon]|nr:hypothetical protein [Candidatus Woesearchaeota archaeon]